MSRKTPPISKNEDKTSAIPFSSSSSSIPTSVTTGVLSKPESPRLSIKHQSLTDKSQSHDNKTAGSEDVYEFQCKDESKDNSHEDKQETRKADAEVKEKRSREEADDDDKRKKRRVDDGISEKSSTFQERKNQSSKSKVEVSQGASSNENVSAQSSSSTVTDQSAENFTTQEDDEMESESSGAPKVPPLKIVLPSTAVSEEETSNQQGKNSNNRHLPYIVSTSQDSDSAGDQCDSKSSLPGGDSVKEELFPSHSSSSSSSTSNSSSVTNTTVKSNASSIVCNTSQSLSSEKTNPRITRSQKGSNGHSNDDSGKSEPVIADSSVSSVVDSVPPRKRKLKKVTEIEPAPPVVIEHHATNCFDMFLKIRSQVQKRRRLLVPVQPKPPQGFKDYLMNRCSYALSNNGNAQLAIPIAAAPGALSQPLKDLFNEQENERHKLRQQHQIEREKLVLSVEQEILRVHGRAARALANQVLPFSVCTILKDEEVYNVITPEQEEKDRNARSRYNGRLFLSWLQDVDDKWEKIKEAMVLRHHNESESLHAVQKMNWEWKLKEMTVVDNNIQLQIEESHVPMVSVSDFELLPDMNA